VISASLLLTLRTDSLNRRIDLGQRVRHRWGKSTNQGIPTASQRDVPLALRLIIDCDRHTSFAQSIKCRAISLAPPCIRNGRVGRLWYTAQLILFQSGD